MKMVHWRGEEACAMSQCRSPAISWPKEVGWNLGMCLAEPQDPWPLRVEQQDPPPRHALSIKPLPTHMHPLYMQLPGDHSLWCEGIMTA